MKFLLSLTLLSFSLASLQGCASVAIGGAAATGLAASQERSVGGALDDIGLDAEIHHAFIQSDTPGIYQNINTNVHEGRVLLTGDVTNPKTAQAAVKLVWKIEGVREVINEVQVVPEQPVETKANDEWINAQLDSKMLFTKGVKSINYHTRVVNGTVYLIGIAQNQQELNKALHVARTVKGVRQVVNHVILKNDARRMQWLGHPVEASEASPSQDD